MACKPADYLLSTTELSISENYFTLLGLFWSWGILLQFSAFFQLFSNSSFHCKNADFKKNLQRFLFKMLDVDIHHHQWGGNESMFFGYICRIWIVCNCRMSKTWAFFRVPRLAHILLKNIKNRKDNEKFHFAWMCKLGFKESLKNKLSYQEFEHYFVCVVIKC